MTDSNISTDSVTLVEEEVSDEVVNEIVSEIVNEVVNEVVNNELVSEPVRDEIYSANQTPFKGNHPNHVNHVNKENLALPHENNTQTLRDNVETALNNYFAHLDGHPATGVYDMVMTEVEAPLLEAVMEYTKHNQTKASEVLGLNRGTLRKKLRQYGIA